MTSYKKYQEMTDKVQSVYGIKFTDMCVDAENCDHINDNSEEFWSNMCIVFNATVGSRMAEVGISNEEMAKVGIYY